ncbi:MAG: hypothetical protein EOO93_12855 [Pedobacter sp.]|nr:MAG: hypothetical protein EOO93_12855 [Pedobacter sp.]
MQKEKDVLKLEVTLTPVKGEDLKKATQLIKEGKKLKGGAKDIIPENVMKRRDAMQNLLDLRIKEQKDCFNNIDTGHQMQIDEEKNGIRNCEVFLKLVANMTDEQRINYFGSK